MISQDKIAIFNSQNIDYDTSKCFSCLDLALGQFSSKSNKKQSFYSGFSENISIFYLMKLNFSSNFKIVVGI